MKCDLFADVPVRPNFDLLRKLMAESGVETLLVNGVRNVCYLAGRMGVERWILSPYDVAPTFLGLNFSGRSFICGCPWMHADIQADGLRENDISLEAGIEEVAEALRERGFDRTVIGVDKLAMPAYVLDSLAALLPGVRIVSADSLLLRARSCKTASEIELMQRNVDRAEDVWGEVKGMIRDGLNFHEVCLAWGAAVVERGGLPVYAAPIDLMLRRQGVPRHTGPKPGILRWPTEIESGIIYRLDLCTIHQGYFSDQKYNICVGQPSAEGLKAYEEDCARQKFMQAVIRPGMTKRQLHEACTKEFRDLDKNPYYFHGVGMDVHEEPRVGTLFSKEVEVWKEITIEQNAVLCLESSWLVEDMFVLENNGPRRMGNRGKLEIF